MLLRRASVTGKAYELKAAAVVYDLYRNRLYSSMHPILSYNMADELHHQYIRYWL